MKVINTTIPIAILVGTRPEIIKMAPVMRELNKRKIKFIFIHSNQHYSKEMDAQIIEDLRLPQPDYSLHVGSGTHAIQTGRIMQGVEEILMKVKPKVLVVHGDTNTTLAGALTAKKLHIPVAHIEAGLRSHDYTMPEEINRILTDRISDILFAPTSGAKKNLKHEGIRSDHVFVTGNTVVDALKEHLSLATNSLILSRHQLKSEQYILVTAHRAENVDSVSILKKIIKQIVLAQKLLQLPVVWPMHPRTDSALTLANIRLPKRIIKIPPQGYLDMICLLNSAKLIMTDSGGIQEEAYVLQKPLVTLRNSTERPETLSANFLIHYDPTLLTAALHAYQNNQVSWTTAFGKGKASQKIVKILQKNLENEK